MRTSLLIDADILAYKQAATHQSTYEFDEGDPTVLTDWDGAIKSIHEAVDNLQEELDADQVIMCLSDDYENFRKKVLPSYKTNRKGTVRPELLYPLKDYLFDNFKSFRKDTLEADDVMGILSTHPSLIKGKKIIVSEDKDMRTIPGYYFNPDKPDQGVHEITEEAANHWWMTQTLTGDPTDGYKGCPLVGAVKAGKILNDLHTLDELWAAVVETYQAKDLTTDDALVQARCARILRHSDYDYKEKRVKLWTPKKK